MPVWLGIVIGVVALAAGAVPAWLIAFKKGVEHRRREAEAVIGSAEAEAERIRKDANEAAARRKKEALAYAAKVLAERRSAG